MSSAPAALPPHDPNTPSITITGPEDATAFSALDIAFAAGTPNALNIDLAASALDATFAASDTTPEASGSQGDPAAVGAPEASGPAPKKKRCLMTDILGIEISHARCQSHMKDILITAEESAQLAEKRKTLKDLKMNAKAAGRSIDDDPAINTLKEEYRKITDRHVRIGGDAPIAMAALTNWIVRSCLLRAADRTKAAEQKIVDIGALHSEDLTTIDVWPLICDLPAITTYNPERENDLRQERAAHSKLQKAKREQAKKAKEGEGAAPADDDESDDEGQNHTTNFYTYVDNVMKKIKEDPAYKIRVSARIRVVLADLIAEFIARFSKVAKVNVLELLGVRTLTAEHIMAITKVAYVLKTGSEDSEEMQAILNYVGEKVSMYREHTQVEKARKWEEMDSAKKAEVQAKLAAVNQEKSRRAVAVAQQKAAEIIRRAKEQAAASGLRELEAGTQ